MLGNQYKYKEMNIASDINYRSLASFSTTLHITFLQTSDEREEGLANDVSVRKQILSIISVRALSLDIISLFVVLT